MSRVCVVVLSGVVLGLAACGPKPPPDVTGWGVPEFQDYFTAASCPESLGQYFGAWKFLNKDLIEEDTLAAGFQRKGGKLGQIVPGVEHGSASPVAELKRQIERQKQWNDAGVWSQWDIALREFSPRCDMATNTHRVNMRFTGTFNAKLASTRPRDSADDLQCEDELTCGDVCGETSTPDTPFECEEHCVADCSPDGPPTPNEWPAGPPHEVVMEWEAVVKTDGTGAITEVTGPY